MIIYNIIANARAVKLGFRKSITAIFCDDSSTKYEVVCIGISMVSSAIWEKHARVSF